jgi:hypothetical protein
MAKGGVGRWNHIFRIACELEADLFNTGLQAPYAIPDRTQRNLLHPKFLCC